MSITLQTIDVINILTYNEYIKLHTALTNNLDCHDIIDKLITANPNAINMVLRYSMMPLTWKQHEELFMNTCTNFGYKSLRVNNW